MSRSARQLGCAGGWPQLEAEAEIAERLASYDDGGPAKDRRYRFIASQAANFALRTLCRCDKVSGSAYYAWAPRPTAARAWPCSRRPGSPTSSGTSSGLPGAVTARRG